MTYESQIRATFNDTKKAQETLRLELDRLDANNLYVSPDKRGDFFELLADALLGFDYNKNCKLKLKDMTTLTIDNVGEFIRYMAYYTNQHIQLDLFRRYGRPEGSHIQIQGIWHELKFVIFSIYPEALAMSMRISKEQAGEYTSGEADATNYKEALQD